MDYSLPDLVEVQLRPLQRREWARQRRWREPV